MSSCAEEYQKLAATRDSYLDRARECAKVTIPSLIPDDAHTSYSRFPTPYQGVGARGVNNLASKLLLALLPPNSPFFRLQVDDFTLEEMAGDESMRAQVEEGLNKIERSIMTEMETDGLRSPIFEALKHLIVAGNVCLYLPKSGGCRVFPLSRYVAKRDPMGDVLEVIIKEEIAYSALPEDVKLSLDPREDIKKDEPVPVFTKMYRDGNKYRLHQMIHDIIVDGTEATYPLEKSPILVLRWTAIDGENFGRSYVDEYLGDLISLEGLSKAILEASAAAAKILFLVNPNGTTRARDLSSAANGDIINGNAAEVSVLQSQKQADMAIAQQTAQTITQRLAEAFLMNTSIQRQGERVTAEEIRYMAGQLEDALGGVYSILSQEFQLPLISRVMDRMTKAKRIPALPKGIVRPAIVTGLEALGRGHDLQKLNLFMQTIGQLGPEAAASVNMNDLISRVGTSLGIDMSGLVKTQEQMQQEQEQAMEQQQQMMLQQQMGEIAKSAAGPATKVAGDMMQNGA